MSWKADHVWFFGHNDYISNAEYTMILKTTQTINIKIVQHPCIRCGFDDQLDMWQDRKYDTATITCPQCKYTARGSCSWSEDYATCVDKIWNPHNNRQKFIDSCQEELNKLPETKKNLENKLKGLKSGLFLNEL